MKQSFIALSLAGAVLGRPGVNTFSFTKREVPQEHAHRNVNLKVNAALSLDNPDNIQDPIFGLLGAKAAAEGAGSIADPGTSTIDNTSLRHITDFHRLPPASHC